MKRTRSLAPGTGSSHEDAGSGHPPPPCRLLPRDGGLWAPASQQLAGLPGVWPRENTQGSGVCPASPSAWSPEGRSPAIATPGSVLTLACGGAHTRRGPAEGRTWLLGLAARQMELGAPPTTLYLVTYPKSQGAPVPVPRSRLLPLFLVCELFESGVSTCDACVCWGAHMCDHMCHACVCIYTCAPRAMATVMLGWEGRWLLARNLPDSPPLPPMPIALST